MIRVARFTHISVAMPEAYPLTSTRLPEFQGVGRNDTLGERRDLEPKVVAVGSRRWNREVCGACAVDTRSMRRAAGLVLSVTSCGCYVGRGPDQGDDAQQSPSGGVLSVL
jgi:hypothetical protein